MHPDAKIWKRFVVENWCKMRGPNSWQPIPPTLHPAARVMYITVPVSSLPPWEAKSNMLKITKTRWRIFLGMGSKFAQKICSNRDGVKPTSKCLGKAQLQYSFHLFSLWIYKLGYRELPHTRMRMRMRRRRRRMGWWWSWWWWWWWWWRWWWWWCWWWWWWWW